MVCNIIFPTKVFNVNHDSTETIIKIISTLIKENNNIDRICTLFNYYVYIDDIENNNVQECDKSDESDKSVNTNVNINVNVDGIISYKIN